MSMAVPYLPRIKKRRILSVIGMAVPYLPRMKKKEKLDSWSEFGLRILTLLQRKLRKTSVKVVGNDKKKEIIFFYLYLSMSKIIFIF